jgi:hypothetical protein
MIHFLVEGDNYQYFIEYLNSLVATLPDSIIHVFSSEKGVRKVLALPGIHIFLKTVPPYINDGAIGLLNTEQLTSATMTSWINCYCTAILDYSLENIKVNTISLPKYYFPYQYNPNEVHNYEKTKDVCFVGLNENSRRGNILAQIPNITVLENVYGKSRDKILFRHKILVNIHYANVFSIHEQIRTTRCVFNKMIVITEPSSDDSLVPLRDFMIIVPYEMIPKTVQFVLENYESVYTRLFCKSFDEVRKTLQEPLLEFQQ